MRAKLKNIDDLTEITVDGELYYCKPIEGYPKYWGTTTGDIVSAQGLQPKVLKARLMENGYLYVRLSKEGALKEHRVHRLIAGAFFEIPDDDYSGRKRLEVNHIDGDKANNRPSNLEWNSKAENMAHARDVLPSLRKAWGEAPYGAR